MFTGLIEETGALTSFERHGAGARLTVSAPLVAKGAQVGDSIAVNGCCLTVAAIGEPAELRFDLLEESLRRTNLGSLAPGALLNLERALPVNGRLGGHFVQGHVDCVSRILASEPIAADHRLQIALPAEFARYVVAKGSIAIDGISLTVAEREAESFTVWIIPHTLAVTHLRAIRAGDSVNLEFDLLAKYVEQLVTRTGA